MGAGRGTQGQFRLRRYDWWHDGSRPQRRSRRCTDRLGVPDLNAAKIVAGSRADIAKVGIGVFMRKGAPKPDIGSVDAFKRAMLGAKSIGWNDPAAGGPGGQYILRGFEGVGRRRGGEPKNHEGK